MNEHFSVLRLNKVDFRFYFFCIWRVGAKLIIIQKMVVNFFITFLNCEDFRPILV